MNQVQTVYPHMVSTLNNNPEHWGWFLALDDIDIRPARFRQLLRSSALQSHKPKTQLSSFTKKNHYELQPRRMRSLRSMENLDILAQSADTQGADNPMQNPSANSLIVLASIIKVVSYDIITFGWSAIYGYFCYPQHTQHPQHTYAQHLPH